MRFSVILAGGSGIRLWPLSREAHPKQLIPVIGGKSLLHAAFDRLATVVPIEHRWVCGSAKYEAAVREGIPTLSKYIGEPTGRDTLAAIGYSCALVRAADSDAIVAFLTSDHVIKPVESFRRALDRAFLLVEKTPDILLTFGVSPHFPATSYGYLELSEPLDGYSGALLVRRFKEKPELAVAQSYLDAGPDRYQWNSGMFVWKASRFLELLERYEPEIADAINRITNSSNLVSHDELLAEIYPTIKKKSVDYGIMEPASLDPDVRIACISLDLDWRDIGSWTAYGTLAETDEWGNATMLAASSEGQASTALQDCRGTLVVSLEPEHLVACLGCEDMVIVHTADATLVCPKSRVEELKKLHIGIQEKFFGSYI